MGRKTGIGQQARRLLHLYDRLHEGNDLDYAYLETEYALSSRQARRDLEVLEDVLGGRLTRERPHGGQARWFIPRDERSWDVTRWQVLAVALGSRLTGFLAGKRFDSEVTGILTRLLRGLRPRVRGDVDELLARIHVIPTGQKRYAVAREQQEALATMMDGLLLQQRVGLTYHSHQRAASGKPPRALIVEPLELVLYRTAVYFVVVVTGGDWSGPPRILLALDRIRTAELAEARFTRPPKHDVQAIFQHAFGVFAQGEPREVVIQVSPHMAPYVRERHWHPSATLQNLPGGSLEVRLHVASEEEVLEWVRSMGPHAEIVSPPALRDRARGDLQATLSLATFQMRRNLSDRSAMLRSQLHDGPSDGGQGD